MGLDLLYLLIAFGGGWYVGHDNVTVDCKTPALVIQNCPELASMAKDDFGTTTLKLVDTAKTYHKCRAACLSEGSAD